MASNQLMTEEEVRQYFISNGGIVRNTDIVTYFRTYLSNPVIRDEARALFKTYVNKLATVKVENGDKFLVLKRQYFPPIDGNGGHSIPNPSQLGLPLYPSSQLNSHLSSSSLHSLPNSNYLSASSNTLNSYNNGPPPYGYPPPPAPTPSYLRSNSLPQAQHYGSQFSLSSNYADPYQSSSINNYGASSTQQLSSNNYYPQSPPRSAPQQLQQFYQSQSNYAAYPPPPPPQHNYTSNPPTVYNNNSIGATGDYPLEYGLPPVPSSNISSPPRRFISPQNSVGSLSSSGSSHSRIPPPYRPPPPARYGSPPSVPFSSSPSSAVTNGRRNSLSFGLTPATGSNSSVAAPPPYRGGPTRFSNNHNNDPSASSSSASSMFQYHRSISVNGLPSAVTSTGGGGEVKSFENYGSPPGSGGVNPPPPVPPRAKRSTSTVERSASTAFPSGGGRGAGGGGNSGVGVSVGGHHSRRSRKTAMEEDRKSEHRHGLGHTSGERRRSRSNSLHGTVDLMIKENGGSGNTNGVPLGMVDHDIDADNEKENINVLTSNGNHLEHSFEEGDGSGSGNGNSEVEQKISVKERRMKFDRIASESELTVASKMPSARNRKEIAVKHESLDYDNASLSSFGYGFSHVQLEPRAKEWMLKAAQCEYHQLNKLAQENPSLVKRKDMNGYTALHWAAKHGHQDLVKLLAGTFRSDVNAKSNGGYTPLHLAAQFSRQEVTDLLMKTYNADPNIRDHSGKKPMQYLVRQDTSVSMDTFKKLKEKRRSTEQQKERDNNSFLRIGSLNVRVKKTTEAFGNFLGKSNSSSNIERMIHKTWGSADNIPEAAENGEKDKQNMPPPHGSTVPRSHSTVNSKPGKRKPRRTQHHDSLTIKETRSDSDSDSAGFGTDWKTP